MGRCPTAWSRRQLQSKMVSKLGHFDNQSGRPIRNLRQMLRVRAIFAWRDWANLQNPEALAAAPPGKRPGQAVSFVVYTSSMAARMSVSSFTSSAMSWRSRCARPLSISLAPNSVI